MAVGVALASGSPVAGDELVGSDAAIQARARCDDAQLKADADPAARHILGVCYLLGEGRLTDHARALELFQSAADDGLAAARFSLAAAILFKTQLIEQFSAATAMLRQLAREGFAPAHFPLAVALAAGLDGQEDMAAALRHFDLAMRDDDDEVAAFVLAVIHRYGLFERPVDRSLATRYATRYRELMGEKFPEVTLNAVSLREAALALHHDRLLRRYLFSDPQLELFLSLAEEMSASGAGASPAP